MDREFCLMRGVDESCLLSMTAAPGGRCIFLFSAEQPALSISVPMHALQELEAGATASFAGEDSMCCIERERDVVRIRYIGLERRARSYEIDATRFETSLIMLSAKAHDSNFASLS
jgi:hypothetical protein